jgi:hypothetical protein
LRSTQGAAVPEADVLEPERGAKGQRLDQRRCILVGSGLFEQIEDTD